MRMMQYRKRRIVLAASLLILWTHRHESGIPGAFAFAPAWRPLWSSSIMTPYTKQHPALLISSKSPFSLHTRQTHWSDQAQPPLLATPSFEDKDETTHESEEKSLLLTKEEKWESISKTVEAVALVAWLAAISAFILVNNFVGPWPVYFQYVPERVFFLLHMLGGMLFGGGVLLTAAIEWLVVGNKNETVLQFWFDKVPLLDGLIVLPALTVSMISGTGLSIRRYGGLGHAPEHIQAVFYALVAFCAWWAFTDLTTQGKALIAVNKWTANDEMAKTKTNEYAISDTSSEPNDVPSVVELRTISNVVSSMFVIVIYSIMVMKPGTLFTFP
jgi:hypothetical protein